MTAPHIRTELQGSPGFPFHGIIIEKPGRFHSSLACEGKEDSPGRDSRKEDVNPGEALKTILALRAEEKRRAALKRLTPAISMGSGTVKTLVAEIRRLEAEEMGRNAEKEPGRDVFKFG